MPNHSRAKPMTDDSGLLRTDRVLAVSCTRLEDWLCAFDRLLLDCGEAPADDSEVLALYDLGYSPIGACEMVINARRGRG